MESLKEMISPLIDKQVHIKPIRRSGSWIAQLTNNENHDGTHLYSGARVRIKGLPYDVTHRKRVKVLTPKEQEYFESKEAGLGLNKGDLSIHLDKDNYWDKFEVILQGNGMSINMNDPMDYLRLKFLKAQVELIAPSWDERFGKGTYKYAIVDDDIVVKERVAKRNQVNEANRFFGKIEDSPEKMIDFLNVYYKGEKAVSENAKRSLLVATIDEIVEKDILGFLKIAQDDNYETKAFINRCMRRDLIVREGGGEYYIQGEEDKFTLTELIKFLTAKKNQMTRGKLNAQLEE